MKRSFLELWPFYRRFASLRWTFVGVFSFDLCAALLVMTPPLFAVVVFDYALPAQSLQILALALGSGLILYLLYFGAVALGDKLHARLQERIVTELASESFERMARAELASLHRFALGDATVRLTDDAEDVAQTLVGIPANLGAALLQLAIFFALAVALDPRVSAIGLVAIPIYLLQTVLAARRLAVGEGKAKQEESKLQTSLSEKLRSLRTIKIFCQEAFEKQRLHDDFEDRAAIRLHNRMIALAQAFRQSTILQIWMLAVTGFLGFEVIDGRLTIGEMITLGIYLPMLQQPVGDLSRLWTLLKVGSVSLARLQELAALPQEANARHPLPAPVPKRASAHDIVFDHLHFSYPDGRRVIEDLSASFPAQRLSAIVGESGVGKSTLVALLSKLYQPTGGRIAISGDDLVSISVAELRGRVGVVFQEDGLLEGTVAENIRYGCPEAADAEVEAAARAAEADRFIRDLPHGYATLLAEGGVNLSAGERKRLSIARTLLCKPAILLLDECTASLDAESAALIEKTLLDLRHQMTILLFTHDLSAAKQADRIYYLEQGRFVEEGAFHDLMQKKGRFFDLYHLQASNLAEFRRRLDIEMERHVRYQEPLSFVLLRPAAYATWKATLSAEQMTRLMEEIARVVRRQLRVIDFCTLYVGDAIAVALPETPQEKAQAFCERVIALLEDHHFEVDGNFFSSDFRYGIASCAEHEIVQTMELFQKAESSHQAPLPRDSRSEA